MKISDLLKKLAGKAPEEDVNEDIFKEVEQQVEEEKPEEKPTEEVKEIVEEQQVEEQQPVEQQSEVEQVEEKPVEEVKEIVEDKSDEIDALKAKIAELEKSNEDLAAAKAAADAKSRLDEAQKAGWLLPAMLKESDDRDSVFVDLAKEHPELFDRLSLVMQPKALPKHGMTEAPALQSGTLTEDEMVERIKKIAAEKGISYAQAAQLI